MSAPIRRAAAAVVAGARRQRPTARALCLPRGCARSLLARRRPQPWRGASAARGGATAAAAAAAAPPFAVGPPPAEGLAAGAGGCGGALPEILAALRAEVLAAPASAAAAAERLQGVGPQLQRGLIDGPPPERVQLLRCLSELGTLPGRPLAVGAFFLLFLEEYVGTALGALRDGETIADRAAELRQVLGCFHRAGVGTERLRLLFAHVGQEFPQFEAAGALLPMPAAVRLCHTMLATGQSSPPAVTVLLRASLREPLVHVADDSMELRLLKMIEILVRLDFLHTQEQLPQDVVEYLAVVRNLRYYDRELRRDTVLSYQLAFFLRKHKFPAKRHMLGPYPLKVCDPEHRVNFEPLEEREWRPGLVEAPFARKRRHLESVGWRSVEVQAKTWRELETYDRKAAHVRALLKEHDLLDL